MTIYVYFKFDPNRLCRYRVIEPQTSSRYFAIIGSKISALAKKIVPTCYDEKMFRPNVKLI